MIWAKNRFNTPDTVYLGGKPAKVSKLTPAKFKEISSVVENLPGYVAQVILAPKDQFSAYLYSAIDLAMDEIIDVISILSGIDAEYIHENAGIDEIAEYLIKTLEKNDLSSVIKNAKRLLPSMMENEKER